MNKIKIEIFCAPNCPRCSRTTALLNEILEEMNQNDIEIRQINVIDEIDYAVELGIRATPAIVINHKLEFTSAPSKKILKKKMLEILS